MSASEASVALASGPIAGWSRRRWPLRTRADTEPRGGVEWGANRAAAAAHPASSGAEALHELSEARVRAIAIGEDRAPVGGPRHGRPRDPDRRVVPGEPELVAAVVFV